MRINANARQHHRLLCRKKETKAMNITIPYSEPLERCKMLSAFEARESTNGADLYDSVRITQKDEQAIRAYIVQAAELLEARIGIVLEEEGDYSNASQVTWNVHEDAARRSTGATGKSFVKAAQEAMVAFAMSRWLETKVQQSSASYKGMWADLSEAAVRIIKTKRKPTRPSER